MQEKITELEAVKVNKSDLHYQLEAIKKDVDGAIKDLGRINSYGRWLVALIGSILVTAIINLVLRGGK